MKISLDSNTQLQSTSATKTQEANAKILFGKKATKIMNAFTLFSKEKLLKTDGVDIALRALKTKNTEKLEKFAASSTGKTFVSNALKLANAKTPAAIFKAVKELKAPAALKSLDPVSGNTRRVNSGRPPTVRPSGRPSRDKINQLYKDIRTAGGAEVYVPGLKLPGLLPNGKLDPYASAENYDLYDEYDVTFTPNMKGIKALGLLVQAPTLRKLSTFLTEVAFRGDKTNAKKYVGKIKARNVNKQVRLVKQLPPSRTR